MSCADQGTQEASDDVKAFVLEHVVPRCQRKPKSDQMSPRAGHSETSADTRSARRLALPADTVRRGRNNEVLDACVFCGATGSLSTEHVVPKWVRKGLQISEPVKEYSGSTSTVAAAETLAIVFHEVCVRCNTGWMEPGNSPVGPCSGRCFWGPRREPHACLDPDQQTILATWAVKTSLLLGLSKFRDQDHGWIPVRTLHWL